MWHRNLSYLLAEHWNDLSHYFLTASILTFPLCMYRHLIRPLSTVCALLENLIAVPLLLSICCIGAMYCMERDKARALWEQSRRIVDVMVQMLSNGLIPQIAEECLTPGDYPLWVGQILFLHCWYAAWLGDNKLLEWALARRGSLATVNLPSKSLMIVCHSKANFFISQWSYFQS